MRRAVLEGAHLTRHPATRPPSAVVVADDLAQLRRGPDVGRALGRPSSSTVSASSAPANPPSAVRRSRSKNSAVSNDRPPAVTRSPATSGRRRATAAHCRRASSRSAARPTPVDAVAANPPPSWSYIPPRAMRSQWPRPWPEARIAGTGMGRSRNSSTIDGGNSARRRSRRARCRSPARGAGRRRALRRRRFRAESARTPPAGRQCRPRRRRPPPRRSSHACETASRTRRNDGLPCCRRGGSTCRRRTARRRGGEERRHRPAALTGHGLDGLHVHGVDVRPLLAVDLDRTNLSLSAAAVTSSSNDSCAITWHQWQAAYPTLSRTGTSRRRPRRTPRRPTPTSPPGCRRAGAGTGWSSREALGDVATGRCRVCRRGSSDPPHAFGLRLAIGIEVDAAQLAAQASVEHNQGRTQAARRTGEDDDHQVGSDALRTHRRPGVTSPFCATTSDGLPGITYIGTEPTDPPGSAHHRSRPAAQLAHGHRQPSPGEQVVLGQVVSTRRAARSPRSARPPAGSPAARRTSGRRGRSAWRAP